MSKLLIVTSLWSAYRHYIEENGLKLNNTKRINSLEDVRGFSSLDKYIVLTPPDKDLVEILDYMEHHGIKKATR